ncbi:MAG TPA: GNAT family N-acetyltransferase [Thermoplasmata archaeon]|nr:GNAT family N-acetyltransferase [Thermoplasmata archaeon]
MWREIRNFPSAMLRAHGAAYRRWLRPRLRSGEIVGVVAEAPDGSVAASGCLWFQPAQPRPGIDRLTSPYILSMFTEPAHRGRSLASSIVNRLTAISRRRNFPRVFLHASPMGEPVYARLGFERTTEMRLWLDRKLEDVYHRASVATVRTLGRRR